MNAMVLVPVAPRPSPTARSSFPDSGVLNMTLTAMGRVEIGASVHFDMQTWSDLQPGDRITVQRAPHTIRFICTRRLQLLLHPAPQVALEP